MSGTVTPLNPTVPGFPQTNALALNILALQGAQSGVLTDYNQGSIVRTLSQSLGSVVELQGLAESTYAFQSMVYGAMAAVGITPLGATSATGTVTFFSPGPSNQAVLIPSGTLLQTTGGIQFQTTAAVVLASGASSISTSVVAVSGGTASNVPVSGISQILSPLGYPLTVANGIPTGGGAPAESLAGTLSRFAAAIATPGLASPVAVADGPIGLAVGSEVVAWASVYEPWVAAGTGVGSGTAGFTLYIDDGSGSASTALVSAVASAISGNQTLGQYGFRPAGVPYVVSGGTPTYIAVVASGSILPQYASLSGSINTTISGAILTYLQTLPFNTSAVQGNLAATVGNAGGGQIQTLGVILGLTGSSSGLSSVSPGYSGRVICNSLQVNFS